MLLTVFPSVLIALTFPNAKQLQTPPTTHWHCRHASLHDSKIILAGSSKTAHRNILWWSWAGLYGRLSQGDEETGESRTSFNIFWWVYFSFTIILSHTHVHTLTLTQQWIRLLAVFTCYLDLPVLIPCRSATGSCRQRLLVPCHDHSVKHPQLFYGIPAQLPWGTD
jgi:hypothetical protein